MKARVKNMTAEAQDKKIYLNEGPKQMMALLEGLSALKTMKLVNNGFFSPSDQRRDTEDVKVLERF